MASPANVLLIGSGGVGTMAAYSINCGGLGIVSAVLRSNYDAVKENGFTITSVDHGFVTGWRPNKLLRTVPNVETEGLIPFDFVVVTTKNVADVPPSVVDMIRAAITPGRTAIMLIQNGINIELPFFKAFPQNVILSGTSLISTIETQPGHILHSDHDRLLVGPFRNPEIQPSREIAAAKKFVEIYAASGKVSCEYDPDVGYVRWERLIYNASYNSACAIVQIDTARMRLYSFPIDYIVRPLMWEIWNIAKAAGYSLPEDVVETAIHIDPTDTYFKPSMQQDIERGNYIEYENIVGEPLREAERLGVPAPSLRLAYGLLKCLQWKVKERRGLLGLSPK